MAWTSGACTRLSLVPTEDPRDDPSATVSLAGNSSRYVSGP